jgi:heme/copper-type cytochrome/quinol oxidase subunit 4
MTKIGFNRIMLNAKRHIKENWGSSFMVGFMLFLVFTVFSLSAGFNSLSDNVAIYALFTLMMGVFLQLASFLNYSEKSVDEVAV